MPSVSSFERTTSQEVPEPGSVINEIKQALLIEYADPRIFETDSYDEATKIRDKFFARERWERFRKEFRFASFYEGVGNVGAVLNLTKDPDKKSLYVRTVVDSELARSSQFTHQPNKY